MYLLPIREKIPRDVPSALSFTKIQIVAPNASPVHDMHKHFLNDDTK